MTKTEKAELTLAVAVYAQVLGLSRFAVRTNPTLLAKAVEYRRESMAAATRSREAN